MTTTKRAASLNMTGGVLSFKAPFCHSIRPSVIPSALLSFRARFCHSIPPLSFRAQPRNLRDISTSLNMTTMKRATPLNMTGGVLSFKAPFCHSERAFVILSALLSFRAQSRNLRDISTALNMTTMKRATPLNMTTMKRATPLNMTTTQRATSLNMTGGMRRIIARNPHTIAL